MTVKINQKAIDALAQAPGVVQSIEEKASIVATIAAGHVFEYFADSSRGKAPSLGDDMAREVGYTMFNEGAIVGIAPQGDDSKAQRLARGDRHLKDWLREGLDKAEFRPA